MNSDQAQPTVGRRDDTRATSGLSDWLLAVLLITATFLAYQPVWRGVQIWDDGLHISRGLPATLGGLWQIWSEPAITHIFDPLIDTVFWIERNLWGTSTLGYHFVNIGCHLAVALLLVKVLRRLRMRGAWLAAWIFALHPVHVESVAWITELKNTMSGIFFLLTTVMYLQFDETRTRSSFALALLLFLGALLSKATTVVWPFGMLVILWWKRGELSWQRDVLPLIPFVALVLLDGWLALRAQRDELGPISWHLSFSVAQRLVIAGRACWFYAGKLLWPVGLCPIYPRWSVDRLAGSDSLYPISIVALLIALWFLRKWSRAPLAAALFFIGSLTPILGLFSFAYLQFSFVADHLQYLASLGGITFVASGGVWIQERRHPLPEKAAHGLCVAVLAALAILTWQHSRAFTDYGTFARTTLARNPECWVAHEQLGVVFASEGKFREASDEFGRALRANPRYGLCHSDLGSVLQSQGRTEEAIHEYQEALRWQPDLVRPRYNIGCILAAQGRFSEAIEQYQDALRMEPYASEVRNNLGVALASSGKLDEAITQFRRAVELRPDFVEAQVNLGHALAKQMNFPEAIRHDREALRLNPKNAGFHYDLAIALANNGDLAQSTEQFREAARLNPDLPDVHGALARVLEKQGLHEEAQREASEAQQHPTPTRK
jgi:tetratricopeptide (TPR) repeat protein